MPSTYSTNLKLELIATGEQSGTWGVSTNTNVGTLIEEAICGVASVAMSDATTTISIANGATSTARQVVLLLTGTLTAARNLVVPTIDKQYIVANNTTGGFAVTVKTTAGTGISVPNGQRRFLYVDSTNVEEAISSTGTLASNGNLSSTGTLSVTGASTLSGALTYGGITLTNSVTGTGSMVLSASPTFTGTLTAAAATTTGLGILGQSVAQGSPSTSNLLSTAAAAFSGQGGNYLAVGQYASNYTIWMQSAFTAPSAATYHMVLNPLGGNVGIGSIAANPAYLLDVAGTLRTTGALTYGGITLTNSVTGTGSMVLSASPTLTGTLAAAAGTFSSTLGVTGATSLSGALTYGGITLTNSVTGTGSMVLSASPTLTGTLNTGNTIVINTSGLVQYDGSAMYVRTNANQSLYLGANSTNLHEISGTLFTLGTAIRYGGITLTNSVTGTGSMVLSASPTLTGTLAAAAGTFSSTLGVTGAITYGGITLSNSVTGTGSMVLSASPTLTGTLTAASATLSGTLTITAIAETFTAPTISSGTLTTNLNNGTVFNVANSANITTFTISNAPASKASAFTLVLTANGTGYTQTWGASVYWAGGTAPTLTTTNAKKDILMFVTNDGGTTWFGFVAGQNY